MKKAIYYLRIAFNLYDEKERKNLEILGGMPYEMLLTDWAKAKKIYVKRPTTVNDYWDIFFKVGFSDYSIKKINDPAIYKLIMRLKSMNAYVFCSCSGHPDNFNPTIWIAFGNKELGKKVVKKCQKMYSLSKFTLDIEGSRHSVAGSYGPSIDVKTCLFNKIPIGFSWSNVKNIEDCIEIWRLFSLVLNSFDKQGEYIPKISQFSKKGGLFIETKFGKKVYKMLLKNSRNT